MPDACPYPLLREYAEPCHEWPSRHLVGGMWNDTGRPPHRALPNTELPGRSGGTEGSAIGTWGAGVEARRDAINRYSERQAKPSATLAFRVMNVGLLLLIAAGTTGCQSTGKEVAKTLDKAIKADVPPTATRQQAEAWLTAHRFKPSYSADTTQHLSGHQTKAMLIGLRDQDLSGMVWASISCPNEALGVRESGWMSIYFFLDKRGACVGHLVDWFEFSL